MSRDKKVQNTQNFKSEWKQKLPTGEEIFCALCGHLKVKV